jgi:hypothetical protein
MGRSVVLYFRAFTCSWMEDLVALGNLENYAGMNSYLLVAISTKTN